MFFNRSTYNNQNQGPINKVYNSKKHFKTNPMFGCDPALCYLNAGHYSLQHCRVLLQWFRSSAAVRAASAVISRPVTSFNDLFIDKKQKARFHKILCFFFSKVNIIESYN